MVRGVSTQSVPGRAGRACVALPRGSPSPAPPSTAAPCLAWPNGLFARACARQVEYAEHQSLKISDGVVACTPLLSTGVSSAPSPCVIRPPCVFFFLCCKPIACWWHWVQCLRPSTPGGTAGNAPSPARGLCAFAVSAHSIVCVCVCACTIFVCIRGSGTLFGPSRS